jgi:hypothetical protein
MSVQAMAWVLECAEGVTDARALLVMLSIANHANERGENSWPGLDTIAREARCSRATVQRRLRELVDAGEILVEKNAGGTWDQPANRRPNRYKLVRFQGYPQATAQGSHLVTPQAGQGCQTVAQGYQTGRSGVSTADTQTVPQNRHTEPRICADKGCPDCHGTGLRGDGFAHWVEVAA